MRLTELHIKNFRGYYGENHIEFNPKGLTLLVGRNNSGKTTLMLALRWMLRFQEKASYGSGMYNVSQMKFSEMGIGDVCEVKVAIRFEHEGEKDLSRTLAFTKDSDGRFQVVSDVSAYVDITAGGRIILLEDAKEIAVFKRAVSLFWNTGEGFRIFIHDVPEYLMFNREQFDSLNDIYDTIDSFFHKLDYSGVFHNLKITGGEGGNICLRDIQKGDLGQESISGYDQYMMELSIILASLSLFKLKYQLDIPIVAELSPFLDVENALQLYISLNKLLPDSTFIVSENWFEEFFCKSAPLDILSRESIRVYHLQRERSVPNTGDLSGYRVNVNLKIE